MKQLKEKAFDSPSSPSDDSDDKDLKDRSFNKEMSMEGIDMKTADDRTTDSEATTVDLKTEDQTSTVEEEVKTD